MIALESITYLGGINTPPLLEEKSTEKKQLEELQSIDDSLGKGLRLDSLALILSIIALIIVSNK